MTGEVQFGPVVRHPSGDERRFGKTPPAGRQIRFASYRCGGGVIGNVGQKTIVVLKSSVPYIDKVTNFKAATGGTDAETLEMAKLRAPQVVRARTRAVTGEDYEVLAREASPLVARARCQSPGSGDGSPPPGVVRVFLVPHIPEPDRLLAADELEIPRLAREAVQSYLDERRLLATSLELASPHYLPVSVVARIRVKDHADATRFSAEAEKRLYRYINPVCGGPDGKGWPFGRSLSLSEAYAALQETPGLDYIEDIQLFPLDPATGERQEASHRIAVSRDGLIRSHKHEIIVEK